MKYIPHVIFFMFVLSAQVSLSQIRPLDEKDKKIQEVEIGEIKQFGVFEVKCILYIDKETKDSV